MMARYDLDGRLLESVTPPLEALEEQYRVGILPSFGDEIQQTWMRALGNPQRVVEDSGFVIHTATSSETTDFNTAAFVHDAVLVFLSLQTRSYGNDTARQDAIGSFSGVVAAVIPAEKRAEARHIIKEQRKQILKLSMPGDQKAAVLQKLAGMERVFPDPAPTQALSQLGLNVRHHASEALNPRNVITAVALAAFSSGVVAQNAAAQEIVVIDNTDGTKPTPEPTGTRETNNGGAADKLSDKAAEATDVASYVQNALGLAGTEGTKAGETPSIASATEKTEAPTAAVVVPSTSIDKQPSPTASQGNEAADAPDAQHTPSPTANQQDRPGMENPPAETTEQPTLSETLIPVPAAFTAPEKAEAKGGKLLADIMNFFATQGAEQTYRRDQVPNEKNASAIMAAATVALNDPAVLAERDASLLPAEANAGIFGSLPGAGAVIEQPDEGAQTSVDAAAQVEAANAYASAIEKIATEIGADPDTPEAEVSDEKTTQNPSDENENKATAPHEKLSKTEVQIKALDELAKADPTNWKNRAYVMQYLLKHTDLNIIQISGMIGNFCKEVGNCRLDPGTHQVQGPAIGIAQWDDRKDDLIAFAKEKGMPWDSIELQAMFIVHELKGKEHLAYSKLLKAKTIEEAADITLNFYERPAARILAPRLAYAKKTYSRVMKTFAKIFQSTSETQDAKNAEEKDTTASEQDQSIMQELGLSLENPRIAKYLKYDLAIHNLVRISDSDAEAIAGYWTAKFGGKYIGPEDGYNDGKKVKIHLIKYPEKYTFGRPRTQDVRAYGAIMATFKESEKDGVSLLAGPGFRTFDEQVQARIDAKCGSGKGTHHDIFEAPVQCATKQVAIPGKSQHQRAQANDVASGDTNDFLRSFHTQDYRVMMKHARQHGLATPVPGEPWHLQLLDAAIERMLKKLHLSYQA